MNCPIKLAVIGAGFWAELQIHAWVELVKQGKVELFSVYNRTLSKARVMSEKFNFKCVYDSAEEMFEKGGFDFVDIITSTQTHKQFVLTAAEYKIPVIVQKPMACTLHDAREMVAATEKAGVPFIVHENYRWWASTRKVKKLIEEGIIGALQDVTVQWRSGALSYYEYQPYFKKQKRLFVGEVGIHLLDIVRFLSNSNVREVYTQIKRFNTEIEGEDFGRLSLRMMNGITALVEVSVETLLENERPPQVFLTIFGTKGTIEVGPDFRCAITTLDKHSEKQSSIITLPAPIYQWSGQYGSGVSCMVAANSHYLNSIVDNTEAETSGLDNLNTIASAYGAYLSAEKNQVVDVANLEILDTYLEEAKIGYPEYPDGR